MTAVVHDFDWPDRFVVGTLGRPGERTFYLQARAGERIVSVALEKEQSAALAEGMDEMLNTLMASDGNLANIPAKAPEELDDAGPLETPVVERFRVGMLTLGWDPRTAQVVVEAFPLPEEDVEDFDPAEAAEVLRVQIPVGAARSFSKRTREVVFAGRPFCPRCLGPVDPAGHICPADDAEL